MSLNVLTAGAGSPLLLLHGFTGSARGWSGLLDAWTDRHRVVAPDLLGHAGSDAPGEPAAYALERQAEGLRDLLDLLGASPATVLGYSLGARLALVLALDHPATVERLVLESPSAGIADPLERAARRAADEQLAADIERAGVEAFVDQWEALPLFASHADLPADVRAAQRQQRLRHSAVGLAGSLRGAGQGAMAPLHDRLGSLVVPTLVIAGGLDDTGCTRARVVADRIPGAILEIVGGSGHTPHLERPAEFLRIANSFLHTSDIAA
ncbi:MAG: alpha/beta fold hydrolase [Chloroflexota bacterium]|jgi:2-succinyl-6-hydroxy-2,4-cyclohexadiene-1-carboxylate synthase